MAVTEPEKEYTVDRASSSTEGASNDDVEGGNALIRRTQSRSTDEKSDPFGDESNSEVKYRTMAWWQAGMIMIAETVSLGILSLPSVLAAIGILPGIILILGLGIVATYTGYVIGQFKLRYPHVHSMADAGEIMLGRWGREIFGGAQLLFLVFIMASHILTFSIMFNTITNHGTCTIVFGVVGLLLSLICTLPRTMLNVSYMAIASFISIIAAVLITMIGLSVERPGDGKIDVTVQSTFAKGFLATSNIVFAYAGHVAFFSFISELKEPKQYPRALFLLQGVDVSMYLIVAVVTYRYAGHGVASPALGSTSPMIRKIAYGIALPTILIAGVINGHVAAKFIYVRLFRGTDRMSKKSWGSFGMWVLIVVVLWTLAWIIAESIPNFNNLLGLISALFASWFTYGLSGLFWLYLNYGKYGSTKQKMALTIANFLIFLMGALIVSTSICMVSELPVECLLTQDCREKSILGLYASGKAIAEDSSGGGSFTCADNSNTSH